MSFATEKTAYFVDKLKPYIKPRVTDKGVDKFDHDFMDFAIYRFITGGSCASKTLAILDYIIEMENLEWTEIVSEMYDVRDEVMIKKRLKSGQ